MSIKANLVEYLPNDIAEICLTFLIGDKHFWKKNFQNTLDLITNLWIELDMSDDEIKKMKIYTINWDLLEGAIQVSL